MTRNALALMGGLLLALPGCATNGSGSSNMSGSWSASGSSLSPGTVVDVHACTQGLSAQRIDDHLAMVFDLEQSYHEMVACGGIAASLATGVIDVVASFADSPSGGLPRGVERDGSEYWSAPDDGSGTSMVTRFYFGDDYEVGAAGQLVEDNVFAVKSYLENPRVDIDYATGELLIRYDSHGPLVELLGFGPNPPRPLRLSPSDLANISSDIEKLQMQTVIEVDDPRENSTVRYELESRRVSLGAFVGGADMGFEVVSSSAESGSPAQQMETLAWDIQYNDGVRGLNGDIEFAVTGGDFDYRGVFEFQDSTWPATSVTCLD